LYALAGTSFFCTQTNLEGLVSAEKKTFDIKNKNYITCTETIFLEEKYLENIYLNPDIVFNFTKY